MKRCCSISRQRLTVTLRSVRHHICSRLLIRPNKTTGETKQFRPGENHVTVIIYIGVSSAIEKPKVNRILPLSASGALRSPGCQRVARGETRQRRGLVRPKQNEAEGPRKGEMRRGQSEDAPWKRRGGVVVCRAGMEYVPLRLNGRTRTATFILSVAMAFAHR